MVCVSRSVWCAVACSMVLFACGGELSGEARVDEGFGGSGFGGSIATGGSSGFSGAAGTAGTGAMAGTGGFGGSAGAGGVGGGMPPGAQPIFMAGGVGGRRLTSTNGANWFNEVIDIESTNDHTEFLIRGSCFGDGVFMFAGGDKAGRAVTTRDGVNWENDQHSDSGVLRNWMGDCAYSNGVFILAGGNARRYHSTDMGATWTAAGGVSFTAGHFRRAAATNGMYVAVGHTYLLDPDQGMRATSLDGVNWEPVVNGGAPYGKIVAGNGVFLLMQGGTMLRSDDGLNWTPESMPGAIESIHFADGEFWVFYVGGHGRSPNAAVWTHASQQDPASATGGTGLIVGNGIFVGTRFSQFTPDAGGGLQGGNQLQYTNSLDTPMLDADARPYWSLQTVEYGWIAP